MNAIRLVVCCCAMLAACCPPTSRHPLGGPNAAEFDERLLGNWEAVPPSDERLFFHLGRGENRQIHIVAVEHRADGRINHAVFAVTAVRIAERTFINLDLSRLEKEISLGNTGFIILQYDLPDPDALVLRHMNIETLAAAVTAKTLDGRVTYNPNPAVPPGGAAETRREVECVRITDNSANLTQFIRQSNVKALFTNEVRLKRIQ